MTSVSDSHALCTREGRQNPLSIYTKLRADEPLTRIVEPMRQLPLWLFSRHDDCQAILKDPRFGKDHNKLTAEEQGRTGFTDQLSELGRHMLGVDPPDHTRLRSLVSKAFTTARIEGLRPRIKEIAEELIDRVQAQGHMDVVDDFAYYLPIIVIAELLGVPSEDHSKFRSWTSALMTPPIDGNMDHVRAAGMEFFQYLMALVESRRATPRDDLVSALIAAEEGGDKLDTQELMSMMFLLLIAGHETTANLIANGTLVLLEHPEELERLRNDPTLLDSAVEEMLRYCGPVETSTTRFALEDMTYYGQEIKRGDLVIVSLLSGSHDTSRIPDAERFDISRKPNRHLAFGYGIHFCVGAPLARLEATIAFEVLLRRLPNLQLSAQREALEFRNSILIHAVTRLPVTF